MITSLKLCDFRVVPHDDARQTMIATARYIDNSFPLDLRRRLLSDHADCDASFHRFIRSDPSFDALHVMASRLRREVDEPVLRAMFLWYSACAGSETGMLSFFPALRELLNSDAVREDDRGLLKLAINEWERRMGSRIAESFAQGTSIFADDDFDSVTVIRHGAELEFPDDAGYLDDFDHTVGDDIVTDPVPTAVAGTQVVVCSEIGDPNSTEGKAIRARYGSVLGMPLQAGGEVSDLRAMVDEFSHRYPWATSAVQTIFGQVALSRLRSGFGGVMLPPILLVGGPGCGKTRLLNDLAASLKLPSMLVPCGGSIDNGSLTAVSRGWSTSRPCAPFEMMAQHKVCNPAIILDEIDKIGGAGAASKNGDMSAALLSMLSGDGRYFDGCLLANVDLRYVTFLATANDIKSLPDALFDRFTIIHVGSPSEEHFDVVFEGVKKDTALRLGCTVDDLPRLADEDIEGLRLNMFGSDVSIRRLQRAYRQHIGAQALAELGVLSPSF